MFIMHTNKMHNFIYYNMIFNNKLHLSLFIVTYNIVLRNFHAYYQAVLAILQTALLNAYRITLLTVKLIVQSICA